MGRLVIFLLVSILVIAFLLLRVQSVVLGQAPRLVLLYATCSLNKDYLYPYNNAIRYTPNIKSFAERSLVFTGHQSESAFSGGGYASLFTGNHVFRHGVYYHPAVLKDENYLIAEAFRDNGYETFYLNSHSMASAKLNFSQGVSPQNVMMPNDLTSVFEHLQAAKLKKAYIQMNRTYTHAPYTKNSDLSATLTFCSEYPEECKNLTKDHLIKFGSIYTDHHVGLQYEYEKTTKALKLTLEELTKLSEVVEVFYKSSVHLFDKSFGETIDMLHQYWMPSDTMIILTSDHGEVLYRDDSSIKWTHSCQMKCLEPEALNVPLFINTFNSTRGVYTKTTRAIDVFPTIAALCRLKIPTIHRTDGLDLSPAIIRTKQPSDLMAYSCAEVTHPGLKREDLRHLNVQAREGDMLYKLEALPDGTSQFRILQWTKGLAIPKSFDASKKEYREIQEQLHAYKNQVIRGFKIPVDHTGWEDFKEQLRSLGYLN